MMRRRYEITDEAWEKIAPLLPSNGKRGGQWKDHRTISKSEMDFIDAILI